MLLKLVNMSLRYADRILLDGVNLQIEKGDRLCLLGRNGSGKSSLLKIITGEVQPDAGNIEVRQNIRIAALAQDVPRAQDASVFEVVLQGFAEAAPLLTAYEKLSRNLQPERIGEFEKLQQAIEANDWWQLQNKVQTVLSRLGLDGEVNFSGLSGGWKRRVLLAQALVTEPDILLLDEPTNHLDVAAIEWLESFLQQYQGAVLFISHDRRFLEKVANRIVELDRGHLHAYPGSYPAFLAHKEEFLAAQESENARFDKKLAEEEVWIRQGIKARRTRNEGRVRALKAMREERTLRRERQKTAALAIDAGDKSGKLVIEAEHVSVSYDEVKPIDNFSCRIMRGDKIAIIGPNGCGKTTLLKILLKELEADAGTVRHGTQLEIAYFDQLRDQLNLDETVLDNVAGGRLFIEVNGKNQHAISYLQDFLFPASRAMQLARVLSGGERNRLLLAKLFTKPANVLVFDEPTNDLDIETLELLESLLVDYKGTVLLVCHDRAFVDNVASTAFVFEGHGKVQEYIGGYTESKQQRAVEAKKIAEPKSVEKKPVQAKTKLSYNEQRELEQLPADIERLENDIASRHEAMAQADFYQQPADTLVKASDELKALETRLAEKYRRWEALDQ
ncbi:MAG: ABC transporter ATP-binding protein [Gammaproteobacteria bacterium CG11_big_fil_rev_8_21_14_0_20_46_22]|nr:MAG: ABC transporter ATP-binding protein [Gammaproteobacteria bacterium CG12_big_fil_rev_8_21_14_0_65_46_12]PIR10454.1 MAG: ABC transporter ATP-binding protein [Gammaproteobacteria bacterium CG11_big_fil_rev_8_21_14_0_20_46_22]